MTTIKFDGTEILNTTYIPRFMKHESAPERFLDMADLSREDGMILISERYGIKTIPLQGVLVGTSVSDLETKINTFKELFSRVSKNLDIDWAGGTLRYVANCLTHHFDRDHFNLMFVPWTAEFVVVGGVGEDTTETTLEDSSFTASSKIGAWTFAGSSRPKPRITVKCGVAATDPKGLSIKNTDTGERIIITRITGFGANKDFEADCRLKTTKYDSIERGFYGVFPLFQVGANNYEIKIGDIVDQSFENTAHAADIDSVLYGANKMDMSLTVPYTDETYQGIVLYLRKEGTIANNMTIRIETDVNGEASGVLVHANATFTLLKTAPGSSFGWILVNSTSAFTIPANTIVHIVCSTSGGDGSNCYVFGCATGLNATYKRGSKSYYDDGLGTWTNYPDDDILFQLLYGGKADATKTYYYKVYYYKRYL